MYGTHPGFTNKEILIFSIELISNVNNAQCSADGLTGGAGRPFKIMMIDRDPRAGGYCCSRMVSA